MRVLNRPATWVAANINAPQPSEQVQPASASALGDWVSVEHITSLSVQVASSGNANGATVQVDVSNDFATNNTTGKMPGIPSTIVNFNTLPNAVCGLTIGASGAYFMSIITPEGAVKAKWARLRYTTAAGATGTITARWEGSGQP